MNEKKTSMVFLCGEGRSELGSRALEPVYQTDTQPGVIETLLKGVKPKGWQVGGAALWKNYRKYRVGDGARARGDKNTVLKIAVDAYEHGCDIAAFIRDQDGDKERTERIEEGMSDIEGDPKIPVSPIGGTAIPMLEGWILALKGKSKTEQMGRKKLIDTLNAEGLEQKSTDEMVRVVKQSNLEAIPTDAKSLARWLKRARKVLLAT